MAAAYRVSAGGKQTSVAGTDRPRRQDELILYTPSFGKSTGTNAYGKEVLVVSGRVADISTSGNMKIEEDGIVLSGIGKGAGILEGFTGGIKYLFCRIPNFLTVRNLYMEDVKSFCQTAERPYRKTKRKISHWHRVRQQE